MNVLSFKNFQKVMPSLRAGQRKAFYIGAGEVAKIKSEFGAQALEELFDLADVCVSEDGRSMMQGLGIRSQYITRKVAAKKVELFRYDGTASEHMVLNWTVVDNALVGTKPDGQPLSVSLDDVKEIRETKVIYYYL